MYTALTVGALLLVGITSQVSGVDQASTICVLKCDFSFGANNQVSGCDCDVLRELNVRSHMEHTTHPHHYNHHFTTTSTTTVVRTTDLCEVLCSLQQGGDACNCLKPGLPGR